MFTWFINFITYIYLWLSMIRWFMGICDTSAGPTWWANEEGKKQKHRTVIHTVTRVRVKNKKKKVGHVWDMKLVGENRDLTGAEAHFLLMLWRSIAWLDITYYLPILFVPSLIFYFFALSVCCHSYYLLFNMLNTYMYYFYRQRWKLNKRIELYLIRREKNN